MPTTNIFPGFQAFGTKFVELGEWQQFLLEYNKNFVKVLDKGTATLIGGLATVQTKSAGGGLIFFGSQNTDSLGWMRASNVMPGQSFQINSTGATDDGVVAWFILGL